MAVGFASVASGRAAITMARDFNAAQAEASTLIQGTTKELALLESESRKLAATYGGNATAKVQAFYQAISAGAGGVAESAKLLDIANKLAIGGVTDITTGVDGLTTATNAYAATSLTAQEASDALFVGMKGGKTTIGALSSALGQIVPIASAAGVSFDEGVAGVSALTTQGMTTAMATTGLRQVIASVVKPTKQAADMAKELGIEFNVASLESKGLAGFLDEVIEATDGSTDKMSQLFGSVEALGAALSFAGGGGAAFNQIMVDMEKKAGAADAAYKKIAESLEGRLGIVLGKLSNHMLSFGQTLLAVAVPAMEAFATGLDFISNNSDALLIILATLGGVALPTIVTGLVAMTGMLGTAATAASGLAVAMWAAAGPWGIIAGLAAGAAAAFALFATKGDVVKAAMQETAAAQMALNGELAIFAVDQAPASGAAALQTAEKYVILAKAARDAAVSQMASMELEAIRLQGMIKTGSLRADQVDIEGRLGQQLRIVAAANLALIRAENKRKQTITTVTSALAAAAEAEANVNKEIESTVAGLGGVTAAAGKTKDAVSDLSDEFEGKLTSSVSSLSDAFADFLGELEIMQSYTSIIIILFKWKPYISS